MLKDLLHTQEDIQHLLDQNSPETNWVEEAKKFSRWIYHLQHERLVHLVVTLVVGLGALLSCFAALVHPIIPVFSLAALFLVLFGAYIFHYRFLENTTQRWYGLLRALEEKMDRS